LILLVATEFLLLQDSMEFEFDPVKSAKNAKERGLPFDLAAELEWRKAVISIDDRFMYGERGAPDCLRPDARAALHGLLRISRADSPHHQFQKGQQTRGATLCQSDR
jgi:hypothetical protein